MNTLRWIAVLPTAFVCGVLAAIIAWEISRRISAMRFPMGFVAGAIFVAAGGLIAPTHKGEAMVVLAIINAIYSLSQARTLLLAPGERVDWLSVWRAIGGIAAGFISRV